LLFNQAGQANDRFFQPETAMVIRMILPIEPEKSYRILNHGPTVLVSSAHGEKRNVMAAAWSMPLDYSPPKVTVVIESTSFTRQLIDAEGTFALNIPTRPLAELTLKVGHSSGSEMDKFKEYNIETFAASKITAPLIKGCVGWLECKVIREEHIEKSYDLFIAEIIAASADNRAFENGRWKKVPEELQTLHYIAGGAFFVASDTIELKI
jgi:flavin reductase (DIM6/NTAB) family NADH-FMN oxidoreductase RutF